MHRTIRALDWLEESGLLSGHAESKTSLRLDRGERGRLATCTDQTSLRLDRGERGRLATCIDQSSLWLDRGERGRLVACRKQERFYLNGGVSPLSDGQVHGIGRGHLAKQLTPDCRLNLPKPHTDSNAKHQYENGLHFKEYRKNKHKHTEINHTNRHLTQTQSALGVSKHPALA